MHLMFPTATVVAQVRKDDLSLGLELVMNGMLRDGRPFDATFYGLLYGWHLALQRPQEKRA